MEGLSSLVNLRVLDVSSNKLTSVSDIQNLKWYVIIPLWIPWVIIVLSYIGDFAWFCHINRYLFAG